MSTPLRVGIVGCGKIADGHVEEAAKLSNDARIVAVCDREALMAEQLSVRYGIPAVYTDMHKMLSEQRLDVVHITTPPSSHLALGTLSLEHGCHVFVEKPVAPTHADSRRLIAAAQQFGKKLTTGYTYLFDPPALRLESLLRNGDLGEVIHLESFYGYHLAGPFGAAVMSDPAHWVHALPGNLFQNNADHLLNKVVPFFAGETPKVVAVGKQVSGYGDCRDNVLSEVRLLLAGAGCTATCTFSSAIKPAGHFLRVYGSKNTVHVDFNARTVTLEGAIQLPSAAGRLVPAFQRSLEYAQEGLANVRRFARSEFHFFAGLNELMRRFYACIRDDSPPPIPYHEILMVSELIEKASAQLITEVAK
ncbi:MAG: hypothetical protein RJA70_1731 [Pseudomonadota bacterium]|jgi:predicted dehydrogenase